MEYKLEFNSRGEYKAPPTETPRFQVLYGGLRFLESLCPQPDTLTYAIHDEGQLDAKTLAAYRKAVTRLWSNYFDDEMRCTGSGRIAGIKSPLRLEGGGGVRLYIPTRQMDRLIEKGYMPINYAQRAQGPHVWNSRFQGVELAEVLQMYMLTKRLVENVVNLRGGLIYAPNVVVEGRVRAIAEEACFNHRGVTVHVALCPWEYGSDLTMTVVLRTPMSYSSGGHTLAIKFDGNFSVVRVETSTRLGAAFSALYPTAKVL